MSKHYVLLSNLSNMSNVKSKKCQLKQRKKSTKFQSQRNSKVNFCFHQMYFPNQAITTDQMGGVEKGEHNLQKKWSGRAGGRFKTQKNKSRKKSKIPKSKKKYQSQKKNSKVKNQSRDHKKPSKNTKTQKNILHELRKKPLKRKRRAPGVRSFNLSPSRLQTKPGELFLS